MIIGVLGAHASAFLIVVALGNTALLGLPMLIAPLRWARALGWSIPADRDLAVYFGRSLGAVIVSLGGAAIAAAQDRAIMPFFFALLIGMVAMTIAVHVWGALRKIQPASETWEIGVWIAMLIAALLFYPG